jgi:hypothetical protein
MRTPAQSTQPMPERGFQRRAALAAALVCLGAATTMLPAAPALAAGTKPDLVVTKVKVEGLGRDPYLAIGHSGEAQRFIVRVTTANHGKASAGPSKTSVNLSDSGELAFPGRTIRVGRLKRGGSATSSLIVHGYEPPLGFTQVTTTADSTHRVRESNEGNNQRHGPRLPVVARNWDVIQFETLAGVDPPLPQKHSTEAVNLYFRLKGFDADKGQFEYKAIGSVKDTASEEGACNWHGERTADLNPWPDGGLLIARKLNSYAATVEEPEGEPLSYPIHASCLGGTSYDTQNKFQNLQTFVGPRQSPSMHPSDTMLQGTSHDPASSTKFNWYFKAEVK